MSTNDGVSVNQEPRPWSSRAWLRSVGALAVVSIVVLSVVWLTEQRGSEPTPLPPSSSRGEAGSIDSAAQRSSLAIRALQRQGAGLRAGSRADYLSAWDATTAAVQRRAQTTYANLRALGVDELDTRYIAAESGLSRGAERRLGGPAWRADVEVGYALAGFDRSPARTTVSYTFVRRHDRAYIIDVRAADGQRQPIWSLGRLDVRRSPRTLVAASSEATASRVAAHLRQAVDDVQTVLPWWDGKLVAYVADSSRDLEALLAAAPGTYGAIAAVTTTVDGSTRADVPVVVVVNAAVFTGLGPLGSRVVMTHEATHVATNAAVVGMPLWVAEGFADYVGVGAVDVPLSVSAHAVLRDIRRNGVPERLPAHSDFGAGRRGLEVSYEQAWLANKLIAQTYGERGLVRFYEAVVHDPDDLAGAFRDLGTSRRIFTQQWRGYLEGLRR
ncbi:MAG: hypothetical protein ACR2FP_10865 [Nocardioidaceae bacterium]